MKIYDFLYSKLDNFFALKAFRLILLVMTGCIFPYQIQIKLSAMACTSRKKSIFLKFLLHKIGSFYTKMLIVEGFQDISMWKLVPIKPKVWAIHRYHHFLRKFALLGAWTLWKMTKNDWKTATGRDLACLNTLKSSSYSLKQK